MGNMIRSVLLLGLMTALFLAVGYFFGGPLGASVGLVFSVIVNFISYWYSDKIVLFMYRAKPLENKRINKMIENLAKKSGIPKPKTYLVDTEMPNAFATGRSPSNSAVAVTAGLMKILDDAEIEGVLAHEMSHIKNRDTLISAMAATIAGAFTWLAYIFYFGDERNRNALSWVMLFILTPLAASLIRMSISREREYAADKSGALIANPLKLASALEKISSFAAGNKFRGNTSTGHMFIVNPFQNVSFAELFSTHPATEKRVAALKEMAK